MNILKLAFDTIHDATKLSFVYGISISKWFKSTFQDIHNASGTFHRNVINDFRNKTIIMGGMVDSSNKK